MSKRAALLVLVVLLVAGCGGSSSGGKVTTVAQTTTGASPPPVPPQTSITAYFLRNGRLAPARVVVPRTPAVAQAALRALAADPPGDLDSATRGLPTELNVTVDDGVAQVDWPQTRVGHAAAGQIVYTLTQFPTVRAVELPNGTRATRKDFEDIVPPILIEQPLPGQRSSSPVHVSGTASVFEATLVVELVHDGKVLERHTVTASTGAPARGTFATTFRTDALGDATIVAFSPSAADGSEQHRVEVPIEIVG